MSGGSGMNSRPGRASGAESRAKYRRIQGLCAGTVLLLGLLLPAAAQAGSTLNISIGLGVNDFDGYLVLDDAEDGDQINLLGGLWYGYDDRWNGGTSQIQPTPFAVTADAGHGAWNSDHYIRITGTVTTDYPYGFIGLAAPLNYEGTTANLNEYKGLWFYAKGDGKTYRVRIKSSNVTDYDYYGYTFTPMTAGWQEYIVPFTQFTQEGWGAVCDRTASLAAAEEIQFQTVGQPWPTVELQLDGPTLLRIDDCEDGDTTNFHGGYWYTYQDGSATVNPSPFVMTNAAGAGAYGSDWMARMTGTVGAGGSIGLDTTLNSAGTDVDLSAYYGIYLSVKGDGKPYRLNIKTSNITDYDYYGVQVPTTTSWRNVMLPFSSFSQQGFGAIKNRTQCLQHTTALSWMNAGSPLASAEIQVDNYSDPSRRMFLKVSGRDLVNGQGQTVSLRGLCASNGVYNLRNTADLTGNWYFRLGDADYAAMQALGAKAVRFYMQYYWLQDEANRALFFEYLDEQLRYARKYGLYLILNLHYFGTSGDVESGTEDGYYSGDKYGRGYDPVQFWNYISQRYAHEPNIAAYDVINEPRVHAGFTESALYALYDQILAAIRANGDNHIVTIAQALAAQPSDNVPAVFNQSDHPFTQLADSNVMYAFSFYEPFEFTHQAYYDNDWYELGAAYPFNHEEGTYNTGSYSNPYWQDTADVWTQYTGNWVPLVADGTRMAFSLAASRLDGEVWMDDVVLERRDAGTGANQIAIPVKNANFMDPKTYNGVPPVASFLPAGWYFSANWIPNDAADYAANPSNYYRLDTTQDHTGDGSGALYISGANVTWPADPVWCKWGQDSGIMPSFHEETDGGSTTYEYRVSAWIKIRNNTNWVVTINHEAFNYSSTLKDQAWLATQLGWFSGWGQSHNVPVYCSEFGATNPSQRDASFPNSPAYQVNWITDMIGMLNAGTNHWTYHVYKSYNSRGDIFGLFDEGKEDTALQNALQPGF